MPIASWPRVNSSGLTLSESNWRKADATEEDKAFKAAYLWGDWADEVAARFANWLNQRLRDLGVAELGDAEFRHWARQAIVDTAWPVPMQRRAGELA